MPKNPATQILRRWRAMDAALGSGGGGLQVAPFARKHGVSTKTVYRDLAAFRELGQRAECSRVSEEGRGDRYVWRYLPGVDWLFVSNLPDRRRQRVQRSE